jgi:hypothetical protein
MSLSFASCGDTVKAWMYSYSDGGIESEGRALTPKKKNITQLFEVREHKAPVNALSFNSKSTCLNLVYDCSVQRMIDFIHECKTGQHMFSGGDDGHLLITHFTDGSSKKIKATKPSGFRNTSASNTDVLEPVKSFAESKGNRYILCAGR